MAQDPGEPTRMRLPLHPSPFSSRRCRPRGRPSHTAEPCHAVYEIVQGRTAREGVGGRSRSEIMIYYWTYKVIAFYWQYLNDIRDIKCTYYSQIKIVMRKLSLTR